MVDAEVEFETVLRQTPFAGEYAGVIDENVHVRFTCNNEIA